MLILSAARSERGDSWHPPAVGIEQVPDRRSKSAESYAYTVSWVELSGDLQW